MLPSLCLIVGIGIALLAIAVVVGRKTNYMACEFRRECFAQNLNKREHALLARLVKTTGFILDAHDIPWIPVAGNLLAVYRHNRMIIPWDDDYDMTIRNEDAPRALKALLEQLPSIGATVTKIGKTNKGWGMLYKVHFERGGPPRPGIRRFEGRQYTWPFVDIFIGGTEAGQMGVKAITDDDLPLYTRIVDDIPMHLPSRGPRSLQAFLQRPDLMRTAVEQSKSHRFEAQCGCNGPMQRALP